jgi:hypothetical protein
MAAPAITRAVVMMELHETMVDEIYAIMTEENGDSERERMIRPFMNLSSSYNSRRRNMGKVTPRCSSPAQDHHMCRMVHLAVQKLRDSMHRAKLVCQCC